MSVADLPGYIQGYVFSDESQYYNSVDGFFIDQAGYSALPGSRAVVAEGSPSFVDVNSARGIELDNTCHIYFNMPWAWLGSCIAVFGAPGWVPAGTQTAVLLKGHGPSATLSATPRIDMAYFSGDYRHRALSPSSTSNATINHVSEPEIFAEVFAMDQVVAQKRVEAMDAGGTIVNGGTLADNERGFSMIGESLASYDYKQSIIGNLTGVPSDTSAFPSSNTLTLCELHFFSGLLTDGDTTDVETELTALEVIYG